MFSDRQFIYLLLLANSFIWVRSSFSKFSGGKFVDSLGRTLQAFASKNPYPWFKNFLENVAIPNAHTFGILTLWGELAVAVSSVLALLFLLITDKSNPWVLLVLGFGLLGGLFLNGIFWLASAWTGVSTDSINLLMFFVQAIGLWFVVANLKF